MACTFTWGAHIHTQKETSQRQNIIRNRIRRVKKMFALFYSCSRSKLLLLLLLHRIFRIHGTCMEAPNVCLQAEKQIRAKNANRYKQKMVRDFFCCCCSQIRLYSICVCLCYYVDHFFPYDVLKHRKTHEKLSKEFFVPGKRRRNLR